MLCLDAMIPIKWEGVYKITLTATVIHILVNTLYVSFQCVLASWIKFTLFTVKCYSFVHSPNVHVHVTVSDKVSLTLSKHTRKHFLTTEGHTIVNTLCVSFQCSLVSCFEFTFVTSKVESFMQSLYMPHHFTPLGVCIITLCTLLLHPFMAFQMTFQAWNTKNSHESTQIIRVLQSCHNIYTGDGQRQENPLSTVDTNKSWEISTSPHLCNICYNAHKVSIHCQHDHLTHESSELRQIKPNNYTRHKQT